MTPVEPKILSSVEDALGSMMFNNPERHNAMSLDMWREASAALDALSADPAVRVIVLSGAGGKP